LGRSRYIGNMRVVKVPWLLYKARRTLVVMSL